MCAPVISVVPAPPVIIFILLIILRSLDDDALPDVKMVCNIYII